jgi:hypothetical protein
VALILFYVINLGSAAEISSIQAEANPASWFSMDWLTGSRRQGAASDGQNASMAKNVSDPIVPYIAGYKLSSFVFLSLLVLCLVFLSLLLPGKCREGFFVRRGMTDGGGCFGVGMCLIHFWRAVFGGLRTSIMRW